MIKQMKKIGNATLYCADCKHVLPLLKDIDACVTDPPYGLSFMGKLWDYEVPQKELWKKVFASLKNGSHLLSFFGSRTYHRGAIPIEDAGFEIRDQLMWLYGSGFPKSHNIGKAVDKLQGNKREVVGINLNSRSAELHKKTVYESGLKDNAVITKGNSEWEGWGTALKPAHEPIVMARKPFKGSVAKNVLKHGTGGINIDECRVKSCGEHKRTFQPTNNSRNIYGKQTGFQPSNKDGRFPANVMHDGSEVVLNMFPHTKSGKMKQHIEGGKYNVYGKMYPRDVETIGDEGSASRFFYCAKASKKDREENNNHPTVKPTKLMRYLCRLITPKGGIVLDPFMGSGSTGKAAILSGFKFVGVEMNEEYFNIACARLEAAHKQIKEK